ncbi:oxidoreductase-like domain-containing protein 1 isoform X2 [Tribolium madens]|uniref:oxidoreductase-like domain-containing protein 1 isoform X2 n=2 Tax=Tribolium madens TaxID=41895 RepID=UPI001CF73102|nr:oxidoreductase-like domain-containing protein 1 isoform X2 [Tribolium madens]
MKRAYITSLFKFRTMGVLKIVSTRPLRSSVPNLTFFCRKCHNEKGQKNGDFPEEPTTCCMSGCPNCVWLEYAEKLSQLYKDGGEKAVKQINEKVTDPNIRAFLLHELRMRKGKSD